MGVLFPFYSIIVPGDEMTMMNDDVGSLPLAAHLTTVRTNQDTYLTGVSRGGVSVLVV